MSVPVDRGTTYCTEKIVSKWMYKYGLVGVMVIRYATFNEVLPLENT